MLEESEARERILELIEPGPVVWMPVHLARGKAAALDVCGVADYPEFDNSSMDGYAVRAAEACRDAVLPVFHKEQPAGINRNLKLPPKKALRIFTGAPIPEGADAVIMQEDVERDGDVIRVVEPVVTGENIRRRGGDVCAGQKIISQGDVLSPTKLALLSSQGIAEVPVHMPPMVHIATTGDELVQLGGYRMPGQIYDSNGILLRGSVEELGGIAEQIHLEDNPNLMRHAISVLCEVSNMLVIAGGVSVGDRDFVKEVLNDLGIETEFWKVRIKPGKPFLFGRHPGGCAVFGLPGNPVSAFVTFQLFVAPALRKRLGLINSAKPDEFTVQLGEAAEDLTNSGDRPHYFRGIREQGKVQLSGTQQSHAVFGLSKANCLVRLEAGESVRPGDPVFGLNI